MPLQLPLFGICGKGLAIAAIPVGLVIAIFLQGMMAAIAIPAFIKYTRKAKSVEATESLDKLGAGARAYVMADHYDRAGNVLPRSLPVTSTDWVPKTSCCSSPTAPKCAPEPAEWAAEPWKSLHFELADAPARRAPPRWFAGRAAWPAPPG